MAKSKSSFVCENCGHTESKWVGRCPACGEWNTFNEESVIDTSSKVLEFSSVDAKIKNLSEMYSQEFERISSGFYECDRVLGGGFVEGEAVLISGEPGIGKSTLLLQIAHILGESKKILYTSGEESASQVAGRAKRLFGKKDKDNLDFLGYGGLSKIESAIKSGDYDVVIVDSIQTAFDESVAGLPGGLAQVRSVSTKLVYAAKQSNVVLIIVGHINKDGKIAGPKVLEHIVDCVLQFEGQKDNEFRVLRSIKNRFGPTGETGIFVMGASGLQDLSEDDSLFSSTNEKTEIGVAKTLVVEGSRPLVLDIQALSSKTVFAYPKRVADGVSLSNAQVISAILQQNSINMTDSDIYIKTSAGYSVKSYSYADLGIITALVSAAKNIPISQSLIFVGETTLNGTFHVPKSFENYIQEILRLFPASTIVGPMKEKKGRVVTVRNIKQLLSFIKSK